MKIILTITILVLLLATFTTNASALTPNDKGERQNSHITVKPERSYHAPLVLMQDLTQCMLTNNGQLVCVDVCGGMSVPYTVCSYE